MNTNTYTVQIDSNYRNASKYPISTDFNVRFNNKSTSLQDSLNGYPLNNNSFNLKTQIDPDFIDANFRVIGGEIQSLQRIEDGSVYISGTINILNEGEVFEILQKNYRIFVKIDNTIPNVFLGKFSPIGGSYYVNWINYLTITSSPLSPSTYRIPSSRSTFELDVSGNVYWMFDCSFSAINLTSSLYPETPLYTIQSPDSEKMRQYNVVCAFDNLGDEYYIDRRPWGYHIISSEKDCMHTLSNGRFNVKSNTSLNLFCSVNINPYNAYYSYTGGLGINLFC
jgi:hypothetical protein